MKLVTPEELEAFLAANELTSRDVMRETRLHYNTVYRFLRNTGPCSESTVLTLTRWVEDRENFSSLGHTGS